MGLITFLVQVLEVLGLISLIGILINFIIDVIIIRPIYTRAANKQKFDLMESIIKQIREGNMDLDTLADVKERIDKGTEK